jgi:hypothetical protein
MFCDAVEKMRHVVRQKTAVWANIADVVVDTVLVAVE